MFALSKSELRRVLDAVDIATPFGRRDYLLIRFLSQTALRVGECAGLLTCLVADNGTPRRYLHLPAAICKGSRGRVVPLNAVARACIAKQLAFNSERGFSTAPASPLFQNRCHGPLSVRSIQSLVAYYRRRAGLDVRATPHTFRHSAASQMIAAGVPTAHVQRILGHRKLSSTQCYLHPHQSELLESSRVLE